jgi:DNA-binding MurR/RpiR family transcriptional regulator
LNTLFEKFNNSLKTGTPAEKRLARYYLEHPGDISYETAASVADKLDLSPMTVGRFLRAMEIDPFAPSPGLRNGTMVRAMERPLSGPGFSDQPQREMAPARDHLDALRQVQNFAVEPHWRTAVDQLARASEVYITSLGQMLPMAVYFASRLSVSRDGVRHMSGGDGPYLELLANRRPNCLLVIVDDRQSSGRLQRLAIAARQAGHRVLLITHSQVADMDRICDHLVRGPMQAATGCLDPVALAAMIEVAVAGVSAAQGPFAAERAGRIAELQRYFSESA